MRFDFYTATEVSEILGKRLKKQRLFNNLTQSQLALKSGVSKSTITRVERGQGGSIDNIIRITIALGLINEFAKLFEFKPNNIDEILQQQNLPQRASRR